jgi:Uncharacterized conserved protein
MKSNKLKVLTTCLFLTLSVCLFAQKDNTKARSTQTSETSIGFEDPLIPQSFAVDSKTQTIVVADTIENKIHILKRNANTFKEVKFIQVDSTEKRQDLVMIYRPKSVAIYENYVVYLASNRDSSFLCVLNMQGAKVYQSPHFVGAASAFSYDKTSKKLYIAGTNKAGYNVFEIDATNGFDKIVIDTVASALSPRFNYHIPKKAEQIQKHDPYGLGLTLIAMGTVFLALIIISLVFKIFGQSLVSINKKKAEKLAAENVKKEEGKKAQNPTAISGDEYAAIAAAIYMYTEQQHDEENTILTINKVAKTYSPWSSKLFNMNVYKR